MREAAIHRVAGSDRYKCSPHSVRLWSLRDFQVAHLTLDLATAMQEELNREDPDA